jgi:hypothetical protein
MMIHRAAVAIHRAAATTKDQQEGKGKRSTAPL